MDVFGIYHQLNKNDFNFMNYFKKIYILLFSTFFLITAADAIAQDTSGTAVSQKKFERKLKKKNTVLLDVRSADEFNGGKIGNALNYNVLDSLSFLHTVSSLDSKKTYLLYCHSGRRSGKALLILKKNGFRKVYHLRGGISAWTGEIKKPE